MKKLISNLGLFTALSAAMVLTASPMYAEDPEFFEEIPLPQVSEDNPLANQIREVLGLTGGTIQTLVPDMRDDGSMSISIVLEGWERTMELWPHSVVADDFQVLVPNRVGVFVPIEPPAIHTYRGVLVEDPDTVIAASVIDGEVTALVFKPDRRMLHVQPLRKELPGARADQHVVFEGSDVILTPGFCGNDDDPNDELRPNKWVVPNADDVLARDMRPFPDRAEDGGLRVPPDPDFGIGAFVCRVAFDADFPYYQSNGSSIAATVNDLTGIMNAVNLVYERDTFITHQIGTILVRTTAGTDPYSSNDSQVLLGQFRNHWNANHQGITRDVAHLFTGRNISGSVIGRAFLTVICDSVVDGAGYGFSQVTFTTIFARKVALVAHELGHNWSAEHCNQSPNISSPCNIMCSSIDGCDGIGAPEFGPGAINFIQTHAMSRSCLGLGSGVRWLDFSYNGVFQFGTFFAPYRTLSGAVNATPVDGAIIIKSSSGSADITINQPMSIYTWRGTSNVSAP
ncbi:MAG: M12 family metallo-peptidase [Phycisphaerales bacterium]